MTTLPWTLLEVRRTQVLEPVQRDLRTQDDRVLGVDRPTAMEAIGWGQAQFDEPAGTLAPRDRALLYAYWNQRGHLEELTAAFQQLFAKGRPTAPLIVIDLGCGPFTGGLALAGQLSSVDQFDYIGVDQSDTMRELGEQLASAADAMDGMPTIRRHWVADVLDVSWQQALGWQPVIVIVSFLLASPTLKIHRLIERLEQLLSRLSRGPTTVLYTNSPRAGPNRGFAVFRDTLLALSYQLVADDTGKVHIERRDREVRYALFHRAEQRTLEL